MILSVLIIYPWLFYLLCIFLSIILHLIVRKPPTWKLPALKEGRIDLARLDMHAIQVRPGKVEEFFTVSELILRNVNMTILHLFVMVTEPLTYLRFCIMDDWTC